MKFYKGKSPCPGCGQLPEDAPRTVLMDVCRDCRKLLELSKRVKEQSHGFSSIKLAKWSVKDIWITDSREKTANPKIISRGCAYISDDSKPGFEGSSKHLMKSLEKLINALDEGIKDRYDCKFSMEEAFSDIYSLKTTVALAFVELIETIRLYGDRRETEGYEKGQQLLIRLCDGTLTIDEFNKRSVGE